MHSPNIIHFLLLSSHFPYPHLHPFTQNTKVPLCTYFIRRYLEGSPAHAFCQSLDSEFHFDSTHPDEETSWHSVCYMATIL